MEETAPDGTKYKIDVDVVAVHADFRLHNCNVIYPWSGGSEERASVHIFDIADGDYTKAYAYLKRLIECQSKRVLRYKHHVKVPTRFLVFGEPVQPWVSFSERRDEKCWKFWKFCNHKCIGFGNSSHVFRQIGLGLKDLHLMVKKPHGQLSEGVVLSTEGNPLFYNFKTSSEILDRRALADDLRKFKELVNSVVNPRRDPTRYDLPAALTYFNKLFDEMDSPDALYDMKVEADIMENLKYCACWIYEASAFWEDRTQKLFLDALKQVREIDQNVFFAFEVYEFDGWDAEVDRVQLLNKVYNYRGRNDENDINPDYSVPQGLIIFGRNGLHHKVKGPAGRDGINMIDQTLSVFPDLFGVCWLCLLTGNFANQILEVYESTGIESLEKQIRVVEFIWERVFGTSLVEMATQ